MISPESDEAPVDPDRKDSPCENTDDALDSAVESAADASDELVQARERVLRLQAELENYRKRVQRMMDEERKYSPLPLVRDLLDVLDNLERATSATDQGEANAGLLEGVKMVAEQFQSVLRNHHCLPIEADGLPFDPNLHEAIAHFPNDGYEPGTVSSVHQVGYRLHDRVVRPTQVIVVAPPATAENEDDVSDQDQNGDEATES